MQRPRESCSRGRAISSGVRPRSIIFRPRHFRRSRSSARSNAGKSSLLNALTGRKTLARVSHTPGRTRQINFFNLGGKLALADLPATAMRKRRRVLAEEWQNLIFSYLRGRANLRRVALLIDSRRGAMDTDLQAMTLLDQAAVSYIPVLTKLDQLKASERIKSEADLAEVGQETHRCLSRNLRDIRAEGLGAGSTQNAFHRAGCLKAFEL
ncbi:MAG: ribosome biogenesis GTP-binding protein YihA/YsxC [Rhizomicrobium sp.]